MRNEVKHRVVKYYLIISLTTGVAVLISLILKLNLVYLNPIANILGLLLTLFIVSFPVIAIIYAFSKNKRDGIIALLFFNGIQWLIYAGCLYLLLIMD